MWERYFKITDKPHQTAQGPARHLHARLRIRAFEQWFFMRNVSPEKFTISRFAIAINVSPGTASRLNREFRSHQIGLKNPIKRKRVSIPRESEEERQLGRTTNTFLLSTLKKI